MADEKKPPIPKPDDKTAERRVPDDDQTVIAPRGKLAPPPVEDDRTVVGAVAPRGSLAAAAAASFQIVVLSGPARGKRFPISGSEALIGSNPTCDAAIAGIEAVHVKLVKGAHGYEMENVGSSGSVTLAGGRQPSRARLASGDLLQIGGVVVRFVQMGDVFSPDYSDSELEAAGIARFLSAEFLRENRVVLAIVGFVLVLVLLLLWLRSG
jgi:type III secretion system (T3SS) inner membrane Yop/YscD-like protein